MHRPAATAPEGVVELVQFFLWLCFLCKSEMRQPAKVQHMRVTGRGRIFALGQDLQEP